MLFSSGPKDFSIDFTSLYSFVPVLFSSGPKAVALSLVLKYSFVPVLFSSGPKGQIFFRPFIQFSQVLVSVASV